MEDNSAIITDNPSGPKVLQIVVENGALDLYVTDQVIRCLSNEFREIGAKAMVEHPSYRTGLQRVNNEHKYHLCKLCQKPPVWDGSWEGGESDLCCCFSVSSVNDENRSRELERRTKLAAAGDPRLDPAFAQLSSKVKLIRSTAFTLSFCRNVMRCIGPIGWLYRLSLVPLMGINPVFMIMFQQYNNRGCVDKLSTCILVDVLREECLSNKVTTNLLEIALEVLAADESKQKEMFDMVNSEEHMQAFFSHDEASDNLINALNESFLKVLFYDCDDNTSVTDAIKNLGNSIGKFLTDKEIDADLFLEKDFVTRYLSSLPETFVWMPIYGGSPEDYVPPENKFARYAATRRN